MRTIKISFFLMALLSLPCLVQGQEFRVLVEKKYSQESSEVLKNKDEYYCKTELIPYFVVSNDSYKELASKVEALKKESKKKLSAKNCEKNEVFKLIIKKDMYEFCLDNPEAKGMQALLAKRCGRSL